jgi:hypothetical protein
MAYDTKVILSLLAESAAKASSAKEVYNSIVKAANVEGLKLPSYEEHRKQLEQEKEE